MNAFTSREHTAYYARLPHAKLARGIEILGTVLSAPALRPHEVEAERPVIVEEILMNLDAPDARVPTLLPTAVVRGPPPGRECLGAVGSAGAIPGKPVTASFAKRCR